MVFSQGSPSAELNEMELRNFVERATANLPVNDKRVIVVIPDHTRSGPTGVMFRAVSDALLPRVKKLDFLIALGTHPPMSEEKIEQLAGLTSSERRDRYGKVGIFNHQWDSPSAM